jgi:hypothetical protein
VSRDLAKSHPVPRRGRRVAVAATIFVVALIALGYFSNSSTTRACEQATAQWLEQLINENGWTGHRATAHATMTWPWIVSVDYEYVIGPTGGEWGTWWYVCVFGVAIPLERDIRLQS